LSYIRADLRVTVERDLERIAIASREALAEARRLAIEHSALPPVFEGVSLVRGETEDMFVTWVHSDDRRGRPVGVDEKHLTFKWVIPGLTPVLDLAAADIVITRVPAELCFSRVARRPMPVWCYTLLRSLHADRFGGPLVDTNDNDCVLCTAALSHGLDRPTEKHYGLYVCMGCLELWHMRCALNVAHDVELEPNPSFTCPMCRGHP